jgi:hypothetical protein
MDRQEEQIAHELETILPANLHKTAPRRRFMLILPIRHPQANLRRSAMLRYASIDARVKTRLSSRSGGARSRGCLNFALHKPANIAHGDGEIVLSLQVDPELRSVAEITAEA